MKTIIIGGGLLGITTAYFLNKNGHEVVVLEGCSGPASECSFANAGLITPSMPEPWNMPGVFWNILKYIGKENAPLLFRLKELPFLARWGLNFLAHSNVKHYHQAIESNVRIANYSLQVMSELRKEIALSDYHGGMTGTIKIFRNQNSLKKAVGIADLLKTFGVDFCQLDTENIIRLEPALGPIKGDLVGGIHYPNDEIGDAFLFCKKLAVKAKKNGVEFRYNFNVDKLNGKGDQIHSIEGSEVKLQADNYILCAGARSPQLAATVGIRLPIKPCKGYSLTLSENGWSAAPKIAVIDDGLHAAITPLGGSLRIAGTAEFTGYDTSINNSRIQNLVNLMNSIYPGFQPYCNQEKAKAWAGLRPVPADGKPLLGPTLLKNLYLNTGHFHLGWTMAAGSGKAVADLVAGKSTEIDLKTYAFPRN